MKKIKAIIKAMRESMEEMSTKELAELNERAEII